MRVVIAEDLALLREGIVALLRDAGIDVVAQAEDAEGLLRIVDESGEGYLYPKTMFRTIALPDSVRKAVLAAA